MPRMWQDSRQNGGDETLKRRLFNLLCVVSLLMCLATMVIWPLGYRSVFRTDYQLRSGQSLVFQMYRGDIFITLYQSLVSWPIPASRPYRQWRFLGFSIGSGDKPGIIDHLPPRGTNNYERVRTATIPCWAVLVLSASLAAQRFRRRRRPTPGHCTVCGYDLRASPDRCPECGTLTEKLMTQ